jgi:hypothetical protein
MAKSKKDRLIARARETAPRPNPGRLAAADGQKKGYRVVPASLYTPEANWIDQIAEVLKRAGNPKANRSMVIREAIYRLQEELTDKSPDEVLQYFIERHRKAEAL